MRGKEALRAYWTLALERVPDLRFELLGVYAGVDTLVLNWSEGYVARSMETANHQVRSSRIMPTKKTSPTPLPASTHQTRHNPAVGISGRLRRARPW